MNTESNISKNDIERLDDCISKTIQRVRVFRTLYLIFPVFSYLVLLPLDSLWEGHEVLFIGAIIFVEFIFIVGTLINKSITINTQAKRWEMKKQLDELNTNLHEHNQHDILALRKENNMKTTKEEWFNKPYPNNILPPKPENTEENRKAHEEYVKAWSEEEGPVQSNWYHGTHDYEEIPLTGTSAERKSDYISPEDELNAANEDLDDMLAMQMIHDGFDF